MSLPLSGGGGDPRRVDAVTVPRAWTHGGPQARDGSGSSLAASRIIRVHERVQREPVDTSQRHETDFPCVAGRASGDHPPVTGPLHERGAHARGDGGRCLRRGGETPPWTPFEAAQARGRPAEALDQGSRDVSHVARTSSPQGSRRICGDVDRVVGGRGRHVGGSRAGSVGAMRRGGRHRPGRARRVSPSRAAQRRCRILGGCGSRCAASRRYPPLVHQRGASRGREASCLGRISPSDDASAP
ncbi:MAG: hypothetical protein HMLKMBBP_02697 [Planctomycetes bacterium]|nr:hypothetical protein [Planctomycetota bacterium]